MPIAGRSACVLGNPLQKQPAVGQPSQQVVIGQVVKLLLLAQMVQSEGDVVGQLRQQFQLVLMEKVHLSGIEHQHAYGLVADRDRQHGYCVDARFDMPLGVKWRRVALHIVVDDGPLFTDRPLRHGLTLCGAKRLGFVGLIARFQTLQDVRRHADRRDRYDLHQIAVHHRNHGHRKAARTGSDLAGGIKQLVLRAHPHDQRVDAAEHRVHTVEVGNAVLRFLGLRDVSDQGDDHPLVTHLHRVASKFQPPRPEVRQSDYQFQWLCRPTRRDDGIVDLLQFSPGYPQYNRRAVGDQLLACFLLPPASSSIRVDEFHAGAIDHVDRVIRGVQCLEDHRLKGESIDVSRQPLDQVDTRYRRCLTRRL